MEFLSEIWGLVIWFVDFFVHIDVHLGELVQKVGPWVYLVLFLVVFCETGLVVTPILPGDSLLFATGALAALPDSPINPWVMTLVLIVAAILGDATNYAIGRRVGPRVFTEGSRFFKREHLDRTQAFYDKHGGKTIIIARFMPIVRTFAPFVAGIGAMPYRRFAGFNVAGALLWVPPFLFAGYYLGNVPAIKRNFHIMIVLIVVVSVMPAVIEIVRARRARTRAVV